MAVAESQRNHLSTFGGGLQQKATKIGAALLQFFPSENAMGKNSPGVEELPKCH